MAKQPNFFQSLLVIAATSWLQVQTLGTLSLALTPIQFMWAEFGINVITNVVQDTLLGVNPFTGTNLLINVGLPFVRSLRMYNMIRGLNKSILRSSKFNLIDDALKSKNSKLIDSLHDDLHTMQISKFKSNDLEYNPKFRQFEEKYNDLLSNYAFNDEIYYQKAKQNIRIQKWQRNNYYRSIYRSWNPQIIKPSHHIEKLVDKVLSPFKFKIKKNISDFWKKNKLFAKSLTTSEKILYKTLIPLHHIDVEWICGIRIQRVGQKGLLYFAVQVVFDKFLTNGKKPIMLFAQRPRDILNFIEAPSAGQHYLNHYAYGWKIGKLIRASGAYRYGAITISSISAFTPKLSFWINSTIRTNKWVTELNNVSSLFNWREIKNGIISGVIKGIPGINFLKNAFNSSTNMQQVMRNEFQRRFKKKIRQKQINKLRVNNGFYKFYDI